MNPRKAFLILCVYLAAENVQCGNRDRMPSDPDAIMFPQDSGEQVSSRGGFQQNLRPKTGKDVKTTNQEIPLTLIQQLNEIDNITILWNNFLEGDDKLVEDIELANRFGGHERAAAIMPKPASCIPTPQPVELTNSGDPSLLFIPSCTRVDRCGGCCQHSLLSCQPTQTETLNYQVIVVQYTGSSRLAVRNKEIVQVEKHTKCKCQCKIKAGDCNSFQEYRQDECLCVCNNLDEKRKCFKFNDTKLWDPIICKCRCRETADCSTGFYFDQNKCMCIAAPVRRRFAELYSSQERNFDDKEKYDIETPAIAPISDEVQETEEM